MVKSALSLLFLFSIFLVACAAQAIDGSIQSSPTSGPAPTATALWDELITRSPLDVDGNPLPAGEASPLDGIYGRLADIPPQWWRCLRCAEYRPAGGLWRMQLDKGVMRVLYELNDWRSVASFRIEGDKLFLFNDLVCSEEGEYRWTLDDGSLKLEVINDPCAYDLRGRNLSIGTWEACPEDRRAEGAPLGCGDRPTFEPLVASDLPVSVVVHPGNVRTYDTPPDVIAVANNEDMASPEGIQITFAPESMEYGVNRVLWWRGDWIEARTDLPFTAMGVQFYGTSTIGWASVFFDGVEVWRGDVAAIWNHFGSHGGYIEVSGFEPGEHVLRVELVDGDIRPLTIAVFGFSETGGVAGEAPVTPERE